MKKIISLILIIMSHFAYADSSDIESCFPAQHSKNNEFKSKFLQEKYIAGLSKPIVSSGDFFILKNERIEWVSRKPFYSKVTITIDGMQLENGESSLQIYDNALFKQFSEIMLEIHSQDIDKIKNLREKFEIKCSKQPSGVFRLNCLPRDNALKKVISQLEIIGKEQIQSVLIKDARGDETHITFSEQ